MRLQIVERALGPGQAAQRRERAVRARSRGRREQRVPDRARHAQRARRRRAAPPGPARSPRARARAAGSRRRPAGRARPRASRRSPPGSGAGRQASGSRWPGLGRGVEQQRAELDRGEPVDHAVMGLADQREALAPRVPRRSTSPTADGRGAAASTSPRRRARAADRVPSRRGGRPRRPRRRSTPGRAGRTAPGRASGGSAARARAAARCARAARRSTAAALGGRREHRDPAHVHVRGGRLHREERGVEPDRRELLIGEQRSLAGCADSHCAGARLGQAAGAGGRPERGARPRDLAPAPLGGERELDSRSK